MRRGPKQLFARRFCRGSFRFFECAFIAVSMSTLNPARGQTTNYVLGTTNLLVGPTAGSNSVVLGITPQSDTWTAKANDGWLHLSAEDESGTGSTNVIFTYDANPGPTRSGTLTVADQTLTVTQAGTMYIAAPSVPAISLNSSGLYWPYGTAVDDSGDLYTVDTASNAVREWTKANNSLTTLLSSGLNSPFGVAVDGMGNVYIPNTFDSDILKWTAANSNVTTLVSSGLSDPWGVAVDSGGNVYIADFQNNAVKKWAPTNNTVTSLFSSGTIFPYSVAVDCAGNVYGEGGAFVGAWESAVWKWTAANSNVTTLFTWGRQGGSKGVAVDGSGNIYVSDTDDSEILEWTAVNSNVTVLIPSGLPFPLGPSFPNGIAVDASGNVYYTDTGQGAIKELPRAFVDPTGKSYNCAAGSDVLPVVLPTTVNLLPPFAPTPDEPWLTITGTTNGVVSFSFETNSGPNREANIALLGLTIPVFQASPPNFLNPAMPSNAVFQFAFSNFQNSSFTVMSTTNLLLPFTNWTEIGTASNIGPNLFEFTDTNPPTDAQRFYRVRSP